MIYCLVIKLCPTPCDSMDCSPPGSSVHGIFQTRILEWVACPPPGDLPNPGMEPASLMSPALQADSTVWATREARYSSFIQILELPCCLRLMFGSKVIENQSLHRNNVVLSLFTSLHVWVQAGLRWGGRGCILRQLSLPRQPRLSRAHSFLTPKGPRAEQCLWSLVT